jgi:hypothetical protein
LRLNKFGPPAKGASKIAALLGTCPELTSLSFANGFPTPLRINIRDQIAINVHRGVQLSLGPNSIELTKIESIISEKDESMMLRSGFMTEIRYHSF